MSQIYRHSHSLRAHFSAPVELLLEGGQVCLTAQAINLSMGGLLVHCADLLPVETSLGCRFLLGSSMEVNMQAQVIRSASNTMALRFTEIGSVCRIRLEKFLVAQRGELLNAAASGAAGSIAHDEENDPVLCQDFVNYSKGRDDLLRASSSKSRRRAIAG